MRLRYKSWAIPEMQENEYIFFDPVENKGRWSEIFGNDNPIYLEIGAGRGRFAITSARINAEINYIALEMDANAFVYAARLFEEEKLQNLLGVRTIAQRLLEFFDEDEIDRIYINFCNPWPKNRQHKKRLSHPRFLELYRKILKDGGKIELKTDDRPFFDDSIRYFEKMDYDLEEVDFDLDADRRGNIVTEYETKWRGLGVKINYLRASNKK